MAIINKGNVTSLTGTVIAVDDQTQTVKFCSAAEDGSSVSASSVSFNASALDKEFFEMLGELVKQEIEKNPKLDMQKVSLILPDRLFLLDTVSVPVIHRKAMQQSLSLAVEAVYKNAEDLSLMTYTIQQNKQTATFGLVGVRRETLGFANDALHDAGAPVSAITYSASAMSTAAMALNGKLKNDTFLLVDIKNGVTRFAFVVRGVTMGYYELPFGHEVMNTSRVTSEDSLFDNRAGKLLVLNAKEKAKAKQLTVETPVVYVHDEEDAEAFELPSEHEIRKSGRRLPKFMQRPIPESEEGFIYENFRVFLKWSLELINNNRDIVSLSKLDTVYVNMPKQYNFLFDVVNKKHTGRGITFAPLLDDDCDASISENLELYGGFHIGRFNEANTF